MIRIFCLLILLFTSVIVQAQTDLTCPQMAGLALDDALRNCSQVETGAICYGHDTIIAEFSDQQNLTDPADQASVVTLESLQTSSLNPADEQWGLARLRIAANLTGADSVLLVVFGDVLLENGVTQPVGNRIEATTVSNANIRAEPSTDAEVTGGLVNAQTVTIDARNADSTWLHVNEPAGWVFAELVEPLSDVSELSVMTDSSMQLQTPLQALNLNSGAGTTDCLEYNNNGLLLQSPLERGPARLTINGTDLAFNGTAYIQASDNLIVQVLEGAVQVNANEVSQQLVAGTQVAVPLNAGGMTAGIPGELQPYDEELLATLPLVLLDREFEMATALAADELEALASCIISTPTNVNLRSGPSTAFPLEGTLEAESSASVRGQITGADQLIWWQLIDESWVRSDVVEAGANCDNVPNVEDIPEPPPPTAAGAVGPVDVVYRLEACSPVSGTPVAGQIISFAYNGGSWPSRAEARQVIPELTGSVTVNGEPLSTTLSTLQWGENNYGVTIAGSWSATAGTHAVNAQLSLYGGIVADCSITIGE